MKDYRILGAAFFLTVLVPFSSFSKKCPDFSGNYKGRCKADNGTEWDTVLNLKQRKCKFLAVEESNSGLLQEGDYDLRGASQVDQVNSSAKMYLRSDAIYWDEKAKKLKFSRSLQDILPKYESKFGVGLRILEFHFGDIEKISDDTLKATHNMTWVRTYAETVNQQSFKINCELKKTN